MKFGEEMRSVINISRARDKEKIWIPDINWTYMTYRTPVGCSNHWATLDSWRALPYTWFNPDQNSWPCLAMLKYWLIILILIIFRLVSILSFYLVALVSLSQGKITTLKRQISLHWMNYWSIFHGIVLSWKRMWTSVLKESMTYY